MGYSGAGGELIYEKNQKKKISLHRPFNSNASIHVQCQSVLKYRIKYFLLLNGKITFY